MIKLIKSYQKLANIFFFALVYIFEKLCHFYFIFLDLFTKKINYFFIEKSLIILFYLNMQEKYSKVSISKHLFESINTNVIACELSLFTLCSLVTKSLMKNI